MSFFKSLKDIGSRLMADAENALNRVSNKATFQRVCQASFLIAAADGHVSDEERVICGKVIAKKLPKFSAREVAAELDTAADICALSMVAGKIELMDNIAKVNNVEDARVIMLAVLAVANADNEFQPSEQKVAREICQRLGLRPADYGL